MIQNVASTLVLDASSKFSVVMTENSQVIWRAALLTNLPKPSSRAASSRSLFRTLHHGCRAATERLCAASRMSWATARRIQLFFGRQVVICIARVHAPRPDQCRVSPGQQHLASRPDPSPLLAMIEPRRHLGMAGSGSRVTGFRVGCHWSPSNTLLAPKVATLAFTAPTTHVREDSCSHFKTARSLRAAPTHQCRPVARCSDFMLRLRTGTRQDFSGLSSDTR